MVPRLRQRSRGLCGKPADADPATIRPLVLGIRSRSMGTCRPTYMYAVAPHVAVCHAMLWRYAPSSDAVPSLRPRAHTAIPNCHCTPSSATLAEVYARRAEHANMVPQPQASARALSKSNSRRCVDDQPSMRPGVARYADASLPSRTKNKTNPPSLERPLQQHLHP